jgi:hypothetical protein
VFNTNIRFNQSFVYIIKGKCDLSRDDFEQPRYTRLLVMLFIPKFQDFCAFGLLELHCRCLGIYACPFEDYGVCGVIITDYKISLLFWVDFLQIEFLPGYVAFQVALSGLFGITKEP